MVLSSISNFCCVPDSTNTPFTSLNSQRMKISYNIKHIFVDEKYISWRVGNLKNDFLTFTF